MEKVNIDKALTLTSNDKRLTVIKQRQAVSDKLFFILGIEDETDWISAKSIDVEQAKSLIAYLNANIILAENEG
jgi:hypothetical protein